MKGSLIFLIFASFAGLALFGFIAMNHEGSHGGCLAATENGTPCPAKTNALFSVAFHFDILKKFSTAVFGKNISTALVSFLLLFFAVNAAIAAPGRKTALPYLRSARKKKKLSLWILSRCFAHWLALHENSPAILPHA